MAEAAAAGPVAATRWRRPSGATVQRWLFGGWTGLVFAFLYIPILLLVVFSFNHSKLGIRWTGFTTEWYAKLFSNQVLLGAFQNSLIVACFTTILATLLGTIGAWLMFRYRFPARRMLGLLIFIPMVMPEVLMGTSLLTLFVQTGPPINAVISTALDPVLGWINGLLGSRLTSPRIELGFLALIISHTTFCFPFVLVGVQARLEGIDPFLEEAAMDLGATPIQAFWKVIVPYLMPAIIAGALMSFTLSFDEYIVSVFLADASSQTLPLKVYGMAKKGLSPELNALSAIFVAATFLLVLLTQVIKKRT